jgi:hypothetical protein
MARSRDLSGRLDDFTERMRERRAEAKVRLLQEDNRRLKDELRSIRSDLDRERSQREEMMDAIRSRQPKVTVKRRGGLIRTVVIGGGAYVLGTRAGRERYDQIREAVRGFMQRRASMGMETGTQPQTQPTTGQWGQSQAS